MEINLKPYEDSILKKLQKTQKKVFYNGWTINKTLEGGYNSFEVFNLNISGQRNNKVRIQEISKYVTLENTKIIDFGCNTGGLMFHIKNPKFVLGVDFDKHSIKACNYIHKLLIKEDSSLKDKYKFLCKDLNNVNYNFIDNYIPNKADIIFLMSLGSWINNWRNLYEYSLTKGKQIILEVNNAKEGKEQLDFFYENNKKIQKIIDNSKDDTTGNNKRSTYLIK